MNGKTFYIKAKRKLIYTGITPLINWIRIFKYKSFSTCIDVVGKPILNQPMLTLGNGRIIFHENVKIGVRNAPYFFNTYAYIDARSVQSRITIEKNVWINNNACLVSEGIGIYICEDTLIGANFCVYDSDFHDLRINNRLSGTSKTAPVLIGRNVFIGSDVTILKGVTIGDNSVVANNSVVTKSIPTNVIAGGNPCRVIKALA